MFRPIITAIALALVCNSSVLAQTHEHRINDRFKELLSTAAELFDEEDGNLPNSPAAARLIQQTIGDIPGADLNDEDWYCIIHVVRWSDDDSTFIGDTTSAKQDLEGQHWYVFRGGKHPVAGEEFASGRRIWGSRRVWLLYVHLNMHTEVQKRYKPSYLVTLTKKGPANIKALKELASIFPTIAREPGPDGKTPSVRANYWGSGPIEMKGWTTSDISVLPALVTQERIIDSKTQTIVGQLDPAREAELKLGNAAIFDNEGRHRWDAGIGVPVHRASDLQLDAAAGIATPKKIDKTSILAMLSIYPYPVDLKSTESQAIPHILFGVDVSEKPSNELFMGIGWGPIFANFYVGASYVKLGAPNASGKTREWQATGGVFLKARGILEKLK